MNKPNINVNVTGSQEPSTPPKNLIELTEVVTELQATVSRSSDELPSGLTADDTGFHTFSTTLGKPVWWDGAQWIDALGEAIEIPTEETLEDNNNNE